MNDNEIYSAVADLHNPNPRRKVVHLDSIEGIKLLNNNVLIHIDPHLYETTNSGLLVETAVYEEEQNRFKPDHHAVRQGEVVAIPNKFTYSETGTQGHKTTIEIEVGDIVFFPLVESVNGELFICNGEYYLMLNYETLYLAKRRVVLLSNSNSLVVDGKLFEVIMLNGYLLCETLKQETNQFAIDKDKKNLKLAKVLFSGLPVVYRDTKPMIIHSTKVDCRGYTDGKYVPSNGEIKNGDIILISKVVQNAEVMLENDMHLHFDGKNNYRLVQRKYVDSIIKE
jgi:co-chaperonin GroES (HSP10)